jgi:acyl-CoA thioesterase I
MSPLILYFASGDSLYAGAALLLLAVVGAPFLRQNWRRLLRSLATWLGIAMIVMASPPFPLWVDISFIVLLVLWLFSEDRHRSAWTVVRRVSSVLLLVWLLIFPAAELSRRNMKPIAGISADHLVVIGDSISAGIGNGVLPWPVLMQRQTDVPVKNVSRPGAGVADAQLIASEVQPDDNLILVEIGGNDLLSDAPASKLFQDLDSFLLRLSRPGRTIVMFELPLLPYKVEYGRIQRRLAAHYGVFLIPKHYFAAVIAGSDATSDGLHLSETGARRMAALVENILSPVLRQHSATMNSTVNSMLP